MSPGETVFLCLVVGAFTLFGCLLAFASWDEMRNRKREARK